MGLSLDVDWVSLSLTVWPLESVKVDSFFSYIFANISQTIQVRGVKVLPYMYLSELPLFYLYSFSVGRTF